MRAKIRKRIGALSLSLAMCLSLLPAAALAAEPDASITNIPEGMTIEDTVVTEYNGTAAKLDIPEGVTEIGDNAFWSNSSLEAVTLPSTLKTIGDGAFGRTGLAEVTIPDGVTEIGDSAFFGTNSLTKLAFGDGSQLSSIGENAFYSSALTSVTLPAGVTTIGDSAFERCEDLSSVTVNGTVVGESMFYKSGVQSASLPNVETLGKSAFADCTDLTGLYMPQVKYIGQSAFQSTSLTEFVLPDTLESTESSILSYTDLTCLTVSLDTILKDGIDPGTFLNAFYNLSPYENNTQIILTDVDRDITLLENGLKTQAKEIQFSTAMYQAFLVTDVQATLGTITNQSGIEVNVNGSPLQTGGAMPADAASDAYLYRLALSYDTGSGETGILLEPEFGNLTGTYTAAIDHTVSSVTLTAIPSASGASIAITVNGTAVTAETDHTAEIPLNIGENIIAITVTSQNGEVEKTYTLMVSRNDEPPKNLQISTAEELLAFASDINSGAYEDTSDMLVELTADIDLEGQAWTPIGDKGIYYFEGVFDGNGHTIRSLTLNTQGGTYLGLFGGTANTTIRDVHVTGTLHNTVSAQNKYIGGIVGLAQYCEITGCTAEFAVTCEDGATLGMVVGGIVGEADHSRIENCTSNTAISGKAFGYWGGITGAAVDTDLVNAVNRGDIAITETDGYIYAGGIAGAAQAGAAISDCVNEGAITLSADGFYNRTIGGVCGQLLSSTLSRCTNNGDVSAKAYNTAGLAASVSTSSEDGPSVIISCLNNGKVQSEASGSYVAGIVASASDSYNLGTRIESCISLGNVSGATAHAIAANSKNVSFSGNYYDSAIESVGSIPEVVSDGSTGKTSAELYTQKFVDEINSLGGHFRLDEDGKLEVIPPFYTLTVEGSAAENTGAGEYEAGAEVTIDAGSKPGYRFAGWVVTAGDATLADASSVRTTFIMPAGAVTVTANFKSASGGGSSGGSPTYRPDVEDPEGGDVSVKPSTPHKGDKVTITPKPEDGYEVGEVIVTDKNGSKINVTDNGDGTYSFKQPSGKVNIEVIFREIRPEVLPFTDVTESAWYYEAVRYVYENDLMAGTSSITFSPDGITTRAQIATILWRLAGSPVVDYLMGFDDVDPAAYYSEAVRWAASEGIVSGYGNGKFGPDDPITREQFAAMLYRYIQKQGGGFTGAWAFPLDFADADQVSSYAYEALCWMTMNGIINGTGDNQLDPQGTATRAQVAVMLMRFCESIGQ